MPSSWWASHAAALARRFISALAPAVGASGRPLLALSIRPSGSSAESGSPEAEASAKNSSTLLGSRLDLWASLTSTTTHLDPSCTKAIRSPGVASERIFLRFDTHRRGSPLPDDGRRRIILETTRPDGVST